MFIFTREKDRVKVQIEAKTSVPTRWFCFAWNCNDEVYADLLVKSFEANLAEKLKAVREEEYNKGWKDAKAKHARETWFGGYF